MLRTLVSRIVFSIQLYMQGQLVLISTSEFTVSSQAICSENLVMQVLFCSRHYRKYFQQISIFNGKPS